MESSRLLWPSLLDVPLLIIGGRVSLEVRYLFLLGLCLTDQGLGISDCCAGVPSWLLAGIQT